MFFQIERSGPPDCGPARSDSPFPLSTSLTLPDRADRLLCFISVLSPGPILPGASKTRQSFALPPGSPDPRGRPPAPTSGRRTERRVPARHAYTCHAPSGSAAGASRHPLALTPGVLLRLSPSQLLTLGLERGMHFAASAATVRRSSGWQIRHRPTLLHTGLTAHPWQLCGQRRPAPPRLRRKCQCLRRGAFGAQRHLRRVSVPPDISGPVPSVHSPLHPSDSALFSVLPACHFD